MLIKDVCRICNLTKKAVEYYEYQGLIKPETAENGYRAYRSEDVDRLKEISVLRRCGISISDIRTILSSQDKSSALARYRHISAINLQKIQTMQARMDKLIQNYDISQIFNDFASENEQGYTISEKLMMAFPGSYGILLSLHFGTFLNISIETEAQQKAYENIIAYLDEAPTQISDELAGYLEETFRSLSYNELENLHTNTKNAVNSAIASPEAYFSENSVEEYLQYRLSEEFRESPAGRMAELIVQFQKNSGYRDIFIANLKKLSPSYNAYLSELESANEKFIEIYPQAKQMYGEE